MKKILVLIFASILLSACFKTKTTRVNAIYAPKVDSIKLVYNKLEIAYDSILNEYFAASASLNEKYQTRQSHLSRIDSVNHLKGLVIHDWGIIIDQWENALKYK